MEDYQKEDKHSHETREYEISLIKNVLELMNDSSLLDDLEWLFVIKGCSLQSCEGVGSKYGTEFLNIQEIVDSFSSFVQDKKKNGNKDNSNRPTDQESMLNIEDEVAVATEKSENTRIENYVNYDTAAKFLESIDHLSENKNSELLKCKVTDELENVIEEQDGISGSQYNRDIENIANNYEEHNVLRLKDDSEAGNINQKCHKLMRFHSDQIVCKTNDKKCHVCNKKFQSNKALRGHLKSHRNKARSKVVNKTEAEENCRYKCKLCGDIFLHEEYLHKHMNRKVSCRDKEIILRESLPAEIIKYKDKRTGEEKEVSVTDLLQSIDFGNKAFKCPVCQQEHKQGSHLIKHIMCKHSKSKPHACQFCKRRFKFQCNMDTHKLQQHKELIKFVSCDYCKKSYISEEKLKHHLLFKCPRNINQSFKCDTCSYVAKSKTKLEQHMNSHSGVQFPCEICGRKLATKSSLRTHLQALHGLNNQFKCDVCGEEFKSSTQCASHHKTKHEKPQFYCSICKKSFREASYFRKHALYHTNETPFTCEICGKSFRQENLLVIHHRLHTGETPYKCKMCDASFRCSRSLKFHQRSHFPGSHMCDICGKILKSSWRLKEHNRLHHQPNVDNGRSTDNIRRCQYCGENFKTMIKYKTHVLKKHSEKVMEVQSQSGVKFHQCNVCLKMFDRKPVLTDHIAAHEKNPFFCTICLKLFKTAAGLSKHTKMRHSAVDTVQNENVTVLSNARKYCSTPKAISKPSRLVEKSKKLKTVNRKSRAVNKVETVNMDRFPLTRTEPGSFCNLDEPEYTAVLATDLETRMEPQHYANIYRTMNLHDANLVNLPMNVEMPVDNTFLNESLIAANNIDRSRPLSTFLNELQNTTTGQCQSILPKF